MLMGDPGRADLAALALGVASPASEGAQAPRHVPIKAISLAVAQKCNLGCTYCYAQQGTFGGAAKDMPPDTAKAAIDHLLREAKRGDVFTLGFMGGEPLINRATLHSSTRYAAAQAMVRGVGIGFSLTTNATLVNADDIALYQQYGFTLTVSVDGLQVTHDRLRPHRSGKGSFEKLARNLNKLFSVEPRHFRVLARVTVTPSNLDLPQTMAGLLELGFDAIMFSPMLSAPSGKEEMHSEELDALLDQLIACGRVFREALKEGRIVPFTNLLTTLQRIHRYEREEYPCGAGGGYMGVSATGGLYACHRFVDDADGLMGDVFKGVDAELQATWLEERNLERQSPCTDCWARHLCSGSCHYEVIKRGRPACDYIRGWLTYCLALYVELAREQPDMLKAILAKR
ncbi:radical SAM protein [Mesorhizobium sp. M0013]|uniref:radical SAM/SPASM domain-containing protein n=1 Tax=Mesorhizobium sp. M0013 TaxID=2956841 RepID=UPI003337CCF2